MRQISSSPDDEEEDEESVQQFGNMRVAAASSSAAGSAGSSTLYTSTGPAATFTTPNAAPNPAHFNRRRWIDHQLALRAAEFTETKGLLLFAGTWNVNAKKPRDEQDLGAWLLHRIKCKGQPAKGSASPDEDEADDATSGEDASGEKKFRAPDIYVIGFQEIVDLSASNLLSDHRQFNNAEQHIAMKCRCHFVDWARSRCSLV